MSNSTIALQRNHSTTTNKEYGKAFSADIQTHTHTESEQHGRQRVYVCVRVGEVRRRKEADEKWAQVLRGGKKSEKKSKYYDHSLNCIKMLLLLLGIPFFTYVPLNTHTHIQAHKHIR